ncbi:hypothetical protein CALVIDRAFT_210461 [Calocera viscosa TUFC12733]|uniref:Uncharacterized protein n=1 Tax=Calocera viscosa (strain TUFC12733) TaxID=1330018 RepID=A0A167RB33_CALVF|nr:hypothetical protein CALVIDRAFT_210461 [Calocera viscosa TUFC12733]
MLTRKVLVGSLPTLQQTDTLSQDTAVLLVALGAVARRLLEKLFHRVTGTSVECLLTIQFIADLEVRCDSCQPRASARRLATGLTNASSTSHIRLAIATFRCLRRAAVRSLLFCCRVCCLITRRTLRKPAKPKISSTILLPCSISMLTSLGDDRSMLQSYAITETG